MKAAANSSRPLTLSTPVAARARWARWLTRHRSMALGGAMLSLVILLGVLAPFLGTTDPARIDPSSRNKLPGTEHTMRGANGQVVKRMHWMGTDSLGRDVYSRVLYGARVSFIVGGVVAVISAAIGLTIGLVLLAIALVSLASAVLRTVIIAIVIPEIPRVVRLVRSVVLSIREEPYVEAAVALGAPTPLLLAHHVLPNTLAPLIVQATFVCASAIQVEAILSLLGVGIPPEIPTWGNIMAEGRALFRVFPHNILFPGIFLAVTVLAVNMLGDGLRDTLDPRLRRRQ